jgi:hypothetical protein
MAVPVAKTPAVEKWQTSGYYYEPATMEPNDFSHCPAVLR